MSWARALLARASEGRIKAIACEAFPEKAPDDAMSELRKYFDGHRGEAAFRVLEAVAKLGRREILRAEFDERLREVNAGQLVDDLHRVQVQLEMFGAVVRKIGERVEEVAEVLPLRRKDGG